MTALLMLLTFLSPSVARAGPPAPREFPTMRGEWMPVYVDLPICVRWSSDSAYEECFYLPRLVTPPPPKPKLGFWRTNWIEITSDSAFVGATWADVHTTESVFKRCPGCYEGGLLYHGGRPSTGQLWLADGPLDVGVMVGEHFLAKWARKHTRAWPLSFAVGWEWTVFHALGAAHNARVH